MKKIKEIVKFIKSILLGLLPLVILLTPVILDYLFNGFLLFTVYIMVLVSISLKLK